MDSSNIKIFTAFHKEFKIPNDKYHIPVHVGKAISSIKLHFIGDDTGDNISSKNKNYCELTMLYRVWKNYDLSDVDYVGLAHYRRLFDANKIKQFVSCDIILPRKSIFACLSQKTNYFNRVFCSLEHHYSVCHDGEDFLKMKSILYKKYPDYRKYDYVFTKKYFLFGKAYFYNMFIMKKSIFYEYCNWLFSILFELEELVQIKNNVYQSRVFGFIGERLLNIFIEKKKKENLLIKELPIIKL